MNEKYVYANLNKFDPINKVCVVTGGSSGIGEALVKELKLRKAKKIINIDVKNNKKIDIDFLKCDVGDNFEVKKTINKIYKKYKKIDLFCSNAGIAVDDDGLASDKHWNHILKVNVLQHANIVRNCISEMLKNKSGWFLITASAAGLLSQVGSATYSTTKHATGGVAGINGMLEPEDVAKISLDQMALGKFLITPHEIVKKYIKIKSEDTDKWILGMRKLYKKFVS